MRHGEFPIDSKFAEFTEDQNTNNIRNTIIRANNAMASVKAKPKMAYPNNCCFRDGFLEYPVIKLPKTVPIPAPVPATPTVATPAPINLAASCI